jgi:hypothetical protein
MLFWKKTKKITLRCLTTTEMLPQLFPIVRLSKALPTWWRGVPPYLDEEVASAELKKRFNPFAPPKMAKTIKHCYAVQKLWENSLVIPMWSDYCVTVLPDGKVGGAAPGLMHSGEHHPPSQYPGMIGNDWMAWKITSPWVIFTEEPVSWFLSDPFYHNQDHRWMTMPGEIEFHYQHHSHINAIFSKPPEGKGVKYQFNAGDAIAYLTPRFNRDIEIVCETITESEKQKLDWAKKFSFNPARWTRDSMKIGGCPLHRR